MGTTERSRRRVELALLVLFAASGFAGLIYQAIWSHYLGLSLGHAAYAQTLVLSIFMGGMAVGAWWASRRSVHWRRLLLAYAIVEALLGIAGLAFHPVFVAFSSVSADVLPTLPGDGAVRAWQWLAGGALIAPQSVLLGMTFPLISSGYLRQVRRAEGEILGGLYFSNSLGAALGALASTFLLLPALGMPGTVALAGVLNLVVAAFAWVLARRVEGFADAPGSAPEPTAAPSSDAAPRDRYRLLLLAAGITGASSFVYEIGWVRMLNQALGTTVHSFELMLAAFIFGLACGGWFVRRRGAGIDDAIAFAGRAQVWMGVAALVSIPVFAQSFRWTGALMSVVPRTDGGYVLFSLGSGAIALAVMFPAAFFAGMTLPLFTVALLRAGHGEQAIGRVYAANTCGAIVGVMLAVHLLVPLVGLRVAVALAALADIALGLVLLRKAATPARIARPAFAAAAVLVASLALGVPDPRALASGVFRTGRPTLGDDFVVHSIRDGKTATVAVYSQGGAMTIATNGKPDAALQLDAAQPPSADEVTMAMLGSLPLILHPRPQRVAVIGWGSGISTHTLLGSDAVEQVDSIEIEAAIHESARRFGDRVARAYDDPRSRVHIDDARTHFAAGRGVYDVIVSEPSNPWVSGVSGLFTVEFYTFLDRHLADDGLLIQWLHSYELDDPLLATMLVALAERFPYVDVYLPNYGDVVLVASRSPIGEPDYARIGDGALRSELRRVGLVGVGDYTARRLGSRDLIEAWAALLGVEPHSDFHPVVALGAPRARFVGSNAMQLQLIGTLGMPVLDLVDGRRPPAAPVVDDRRSPGATMYWLAREAASALRGGDDAALRRLDPVLADDVAALRRESAAAPAAFDEWRWAVAASRVAEATIAHLPPDQLHGAWIEPAWIGDGVSSPVVAPVLAAYAAAARRDAGAMQAAGQAALAATPAGDQLLRQHMLVIAELGAFGEGDAAEATRLEHELGRAIPADARYGFVRALLLAWADVNRGA